ncbi:MAG: hypothetical protein Q8M02_05290 [Candidatus Didemnitutus sp.]|nr:hypothetical protein [Candidatus Didemnitutus sp.]
MADSNLHGNTLRRVGLIEAVVHIFSAAALLVGLAAALPDGFRLIGLAGGAGLWAGWYGVLRLARLREWFGGWDAASFVTVWTYTNVFAVFAQAVVAGS